MSLFIYSFSLVVSSFSATVDTLWEKDSGVWLIKPNEEACERGLRVNGLRLGEGRALKTVSPNIAQMLIEVQMFNYFRLPCFCQTDVSGSGFLLVILNCFVYVVN